MHRKIYPSNYEQDFSGIYDYESERIQAEDKIKEVTISSIIEEEHNKNMAELKRRKILKYSMTVVAIIFSYYYFRTKHK